MPFITATSETCSCLSTDYLKRENKKTKLRWMHYFWAVENSLASTLAQNTAAICTTCPFLTKVSLVSKSKKCMHISCNFCISCNIWQKAADSLFFSWKVKQTNEIPHGLSEYTCFKHVLPKLNILRKQYKFGSIIH